MVKIEIDTKKDTKKNLIFDIIFERKRTYIIFERKKRYKKELNT